MRFIKRVAKVVLGLFGLVLGVRILSSQSIELMTHSDHVLGEGPNISSYTGGQYGLGWYIIPEDEHLRLQHHGGGPGFATTLRLYPEKGLGIVILANSTDLDRDGLAARLTELFSDVDTNDMTFVSMAQFQ